ncbi:L-ectoine synthase [Saccharothrix ecbatanensis]|jgi:L-ectoine synthase|uniref:L-ectoine synthase n=1 Tax=Saccharothrix ecbatanensis TaxID=1105145 RepID=A0A7W9HHF2_9PSEU|nr:ectoine synthase [Saccharothrix ecbatanensis]MBB5802220.1 L-ectoine synthase [Saccharothrix ecbatanensis]
MIYREMSEVTTVDWGNGLSRRFLLASDGMGYTLTDTTVRAGTKSRLEYRRHLETCYCIAGRGEVVSVDGRSYPLEPGVLYALDRHDPHFLIAGPDEDLRLVCVFAPALAGHEQHRFDSADEFSQY